MHETDKGNTTSLPSACSYDLLKSYHDLLTTNDICKLLHISKPTVYSLVESHELVAICIDAEICIRKLPFVLFWKGECVNVTWHNH